MSKYEKVSLLNTMGKDLAVEKTYDTPKKDQKLEIKVFFPIRKANGTRKQMVQSVQRSVSKFHQNKNLPSVAAP